MSNSALLAYIIYRRSPLLTLNSGTRNGSVCEMYVHLYISCVYVQSFTYIYTVDRLRHAHIKLNRVQQISLSTYKQTHVSIGQKWKERKKNPRKMMMFMIVQLRTYRMKNLIQTGKLYKLLWRAYSL